MEKLVVQNYGHPASHPPEIITQDTSHRFVTDEQIAAWDAVDTEYIDAAVASASASAASASDDAAATAADRVATGNDVVVCANHRVAAETAQGLAETARDGAVTAQGLAEDAQDAAELAAVRHLLQITSDGTLIYNSSPLVTGVTQNFSTGDYSVNFPSGYTCVWMMVTPMENTTGDWSTKISDLDSARFQLTLDGVVSAAGDGATIELILTPN